MLTGPQAVTQTGQVRIIGQVIGRPLRWEEPPSDTARQLLLAAWVTPTPWIARWDGALGYWAALVTEPWDAWSIGLAG